VLTELAADYPLPAKLLEHRSLAKLKGTYTDKLPLHDQPATGRVHTNYAQAVAVTGRLSSNEPNLQNIPIRTPEAGACARPSSRRRACDRQRRLLADRAAHHGPHQRGPGPAQGLPEGQDVHRATASEVFGVAAGEVQRAAPLRQDHQLRPDLRHGRLRPGRGLGIEQKAAKDYIDRYFSALPA
jgi:DNA polymerase-1